MNEDRSRTPPDGLVEIGAWTADPRADELRREGETVKLEPLKMRLLLALAARPGEVVLTAELLERVWGEVVVTSSSIYQGIAQLRRLLGDNAEQPSYIETVPRKGYRLVAPVRWLAPVAFDASGFGSSAPMPLSPPSSPLPLEPAPAAPPTSSPMPLAATPLPVQLPDLRTASRHPFIGRRALVVGGLAAGAAAFAAWRWLPPGAAERPVRLAVLPFLDRTAAASEAALSQALALDVIRAFERYPDVRVTAADSALAIGPGNATDASAQRLSVGFFLIGELVRIGAGLRVAVRLLSMPGERLRWSQSFEQAERSLTLLPERIAGEAAKALALPPGPPVEPGRSTEAFELYALGNHAWRPKTVEGFAKARDYFQRGIEVDPSYARNYIGLGWTWLGLMSNGGGIDYNVAFARATPLFDKALRLEPDLPEALLAQGVLRAQQRKFDEARSLYERTLKLSPGNAQAHHSYGVCEFEDGWPQRAVPHFQRAVELNPLNGSPIERLGLSLVTSGRRSEASAAYRKAVDLEPAHPNGYWGLGIAGYADGALDVAVNGYREALEREARRPFLWIELSYLYLDLGAPARAAEAAGRAAALLPELVWPKVMATYAWVIDPARGQPPPLLAPGATGLPEDRYLFDLMMVRAMAGLPLDAGPLDRGIDLMQGRDQFSTPILWQVFQGFHSLIDLATLQAVLGRPDRIEVALGTASAQIERYARQGNVWHALHFHRARIHALRGQDEAALAELVKAVDAGCRRGWRLRLDPVFATLRGAPRFVAALQKIDAETARQRAALGL